jgi:hypothetical protein
MKTAILATFLICLISACSPKVGSDDWCNSLEEKHKADWTAREAKDYAKHCVFK